MLLEKVDFSRKMKNKVNPLLSLYHNYLKWPKESSNSSQTTLAKMFWNKQRITKGKFLLFLNIWFNSGFTGEHVFAFELRIRASAEALSVVVGFYRLLSVAASFFRIKLRDQQILAFSNDQSQANRSWDNLPLSGWCYKVMYTLKDNMSSPWPLDKVKDKTDWVKTFLSHKMFRPSKDASSMESVTVFTRITLLQNSLQRLTKLFQGAKQCAVIKKTWSHERNLQDDLHRTKNRKQVQLTALSNLI